MCLLLQQWLGSTCPSLSHLPRKCATGLVKTCTWISVTCCAYTIRQALTAERMNKRSVAFRRGVFRLKQSMQTMPLTNEKIKTGDTGPAVLTSSS